ncbi:23S rRNA (pseudouridine(1915)-N(3))-methyltransferase RlmH [Flavobacterium sp. CS20]|jgi:23S rRNA (pseudouridine1915-N3)-methyltransferase|uniref:23S rRNA (pseudouridine(1915)-N(3))-methyltransferase RlmH n=1 Tax=Flavobacterium sp. CS20 TaxID=2775246 RepID=UPI001B3A72EA|nr:23S rRNA (pseudouridine(1915)-N(3))-methyltransferase RlmH [Flavobacterium sp. CS20]QTY27669.1 23S rRNA (pseudouridine(1915)-N(3))-methyltransferase RlmH [Flavobacterium sp. CS20]
MNIKLLQIGQTKQNEIESLIQHFQKRLQHFINFEIVSLPDIKNTKSISEDQQKSKEAELFLKHLSTSDWVVLLDEKGKSLTSRDFAKFYQNKMNAGTKTLCFLIGGPYGFSKDIYRRAHQKIALSPMTFTHEMIRLIYVEQTYRAFSIIHNLPYHHD